MESGSLNERDRSSFNPFQVWLGFPAGRVPTNYYALLGVPLFESDRELIGQLADNMLAHVRQIRPGEHAAEWTELLDIIRAAKEWLCDPEKKRVYDAELEAGRVTTLKFQGALRAVDAANTRVPDSGLTKNQTATERAIQTLPQSESGPPPQSALESASETAVRVRIVPLLDITYRVGALALLVIGVLVAYNTAMSRAGWVTKTLLSHVSVTSRQGTLKDVSAAASQEEPESTRTPEKFDSGKILSGSPRSAQNATDRPPSGGPEHHGDQIPETFGGNQSPATSSQGVDSSEASGGSTLPPSGELPEQPSGPSTQMAPQQGVQNAPSTGGQTALPPSSETSEASSNAQITPEFRQMLDEIWHALGRRDLEGARATLNQLAAQVRDHSQRSIVHAMDQLVRDVEQFWQLMGEIVASLQSTEELAVADTYVIVVEASRTHLVIRAAGQNRRYSVREIPTALLKVLARQRLEPGPDADALLAAFLAVDPKGEETEVQQLLEQAESKGADTELVREALKYRPQKRR